MINAKEFMKFFEETAGVRFVDVGTGKPALESIDKKKVEPKSDYDIWLEKQDEDVQNEHKMGIL